MPYSNVPDDKQDEMERCVSAVQKEGRSKESAIRICYASVVEGKSLADSFLFAPPDIPSDSVKAGRMISSKNKAALRQAVDIISSLIDDEESEPEDDGNSLLKTVESCGNAIKTISVSDEELRVGNYIVLFGGKDLTGIDFSGAVKKRNQDGSVGESFSKSVDVESEYTSAGVLHVDFEHSLDPDDVGLGRDDVLGYVDWKTAKRDERGIFVERVLNRRNKYVSWLKELIDAGMVGNSSEAIAEKVERKGNGEIVRWPLRRDTLTVTPMEPRMLSENQVLALKALNINVSENLPDFAEIGRQVGAAIAERLRQNAG